MKREGTGIAAIAAFVMMASGCGGSGSGEGGAGDQPKMSPEDVQKEIQKLSPPSTKGKAKAK
ncbi:hypothetical protein GC170_22730 [bacterium]|nr:hypothetical protein [bacterium]